MIPFFDYVPLICWSASYLIAYTLSFAIRCQISDCLNTYNGESVFDHLRTGFRPSCCGVRPSCCQLLSYHDWLRPYYDWLRLYCGWLRPILPTLLQADFDTPIPAALIEGVAEIGGCFSDNASQIFRFPIPFLPCNNFYASFLWLQHTWCKFTSTKLVQVRQQRSDGPKLPRRMC